MHKSILKRSFSAEKVQEDFSQAAWMYNLWSRLTESKAAHLALKLAAVQHGEQILEVGVGTGLFFEKLVQQNPAGFNTGIDLSPAMLRKARTLLSKMDLKNYHLQEGNAYALVFEDESFDLLVCQYVLDLLPEEDFEKILTEFKRVLKPSGRLITASMAFGNRWYHQPWYWLSQTFPDKLTGCRPVALKHYLGKVGFRIDAIEKISQNTFPSEVVKAIKPVILKPDAMQWR